MDAGSPSFPQAVWLWPYSPQRVCFGWGAPTFQTRALPRRAFSGPAPLGEPVHCSCADAKKGPARHCFSGITDCTAEISSNRRPECPGSGGIFGCQAANWSRAGLPTENISYFRVLSRVLGKFPEEAVRKPDFFCFSPDSSRFLPSAAAFPGQPGDCPAKKRRSYLLFFAISARIRALIYPALLGTLDSFSIISCSVFFIRRILRLTVCAL